jgi:hypothetical protein
MNKTARRSFGKDYVCLKPWEEEIGVQCGGSGVVLVEKGENYRTAFFEAFPKKPSCFLRGEGATVEEAEENCWNKYQKVIACEHEMERKNRTDGYGYCKHCSYSSMVFEPLTKCCKCNTPTAFSQDYRGKWYCAKHNRCKPKPEKPGKDATLMERMLHNEERRLPRKEKKLLKNAATYMFRQQGHKDKVLYSYSLSPKFKCGHYQMALLFGRQKKQLLKNYKMR